MSTAAAYIPHWGFEVQGALEIDGLLFSRPLTKMGIAKPGSLNVSADQRNKSRSGKHVINRNSLKVSKIETSRKA